MNYLLALSKCHPDAQAYVTTGDPTVYNDLIWITTPIPEATLLQCDLTDNSTPEMITAPIPTNAPDGSSLSYNSATQEWVVTPPSQQTGIIQLIYGSIAPQSGTTRIPYDNTIPLNTEGALLGQVPITIEHDNHSVVIQFTVTIEVSVGNSVVLLPVFRDDVCVNVFPIRVPVKNTPTTYSFMTIDTPGVAGAYTYSGRIGNDNGTWYLNMDSNTGTDLGGKLADHQFVLMEIHPNIIA